MDTAKITIIDTGQKSRLNSILAALDAPFVLDAFFAMWDFKSESYKKINCAILGDIVYIIVETKYLVGKNIRIVFRDKNEIVENYVTFKQYEEDSEGNFTEKYSQKNIFVSKIRSLIKVDNHNIEGALFKIMLDKDSIFEWMDDLIYSQKQQLALYLNVKIDDDEVIYNGFPNNQLDRENNAWLSYGNKYFIVEKPDTDFYFKFENDEFILRNLDLLDTMSAKEYEQYIYRNYGKRLSTKAAQFSTGVIGLFLSPFGGPIFGTGGVVYSIDSITKSFKHFDDEPGIVNEGARYLGDKVGLSNKTVDIGFSISEILFTIKDMIRLVKKPGQWKLFYDLPSDFVRAYKNQHMLEKAMNSYGIYNNFDELRKHLLASDTQYLSEIVYRKTIPLGCEKVIIFTGEENPDSVEHYYTCFIPDANNPGIYEMYELYPTKY